MVATSKRILTFVVESKMGIVEVVGVLHTVTGYYTIRGTVEDLQFSTVEKDLADALYKFYLKVNKL